MLSTLLNKPPGNLFAKMENGQSDYRVGDVTYHLGETATLTYSQVRRPCLYTDRDGMVLWCAVFSASKSADRAWLSQLLQFHMRHLPEIKKMR